MDCREFQEQIGAFADGELESDLSDQAVDHVGKCPGCAARVAEIHTLKLALVRVGGEVRAPEQLRGKVLATLHAEEVQDASAPSSPRPDRRGVLRFRLAAPLGMAAALLLAVVTWQTWPSGGAETDAFILVTGRTASEVREQHWQCTRSGSEHHDESLSRDPAVIAERLSKELGLEVLVPDFSARGFELLGADRCGIGGRPGSHALYRERNDETTLSVFTVGRIAELGPERSDAAAGNGQFYVSSTGSTRMIAWHRGRQTHVMCGEVPKATIRSLAGEVRTASATPAYPEVMLAAVGME